MAGLIPWQRRWQIELQLALSGLQAAVRTSVMIILGTGVIASTVDARTLGSPIIIGLSSFNTPMCCRVR
jgi:osmoprotectant transport system permease protein